MVVHPSEQQLLLGQFQQVFFAFAVAQEQDQARMMREIDLGEETDLERFKACLNSFSNELTIPLTSMSVPE